MVQIWYNNVPHPGLVSYKKDQNWVKKSGDKLIFPGGGTQFKHGALHYIDFIEQVKDNLYSFHIYKLIKHCVYLCKPVYVFSMSMINVCICARIYIFLCIHVHAYCQLMWNGEEDWHSCKSQNSAFGPKFKKCFLYVQIHTHICAVTFNNKHRVFRQHFIFLLYIVMYSMFYMTSYLYHCT